MLKHLLFVMLSLVVLPCTAKVIDTMEKFHRYNMFHVDRVFVLGDYLLETFQHEFPNVNRKLLHGFLARHDYAKLNDPDIQKGLFAIYGKPMNTARLRAQRDAIVARVNADEHEYAYTYFSALDLLEKDGSLSPAALELLSIEKIVDSVDRFKNPLATEEFAREMIPASQMHNLSANERRLARHLEVKYFGLVGHLLYVPAPNDCEMMLGMSLDSIPRVRVNSRIR